ncbi:hypothetical protein V6N13_131694 [Hibiscus sabdariffa]
MPSKFQRAIGAVKDQTCISFAMIVNTNSSNIDVAVLKATTRDPEPADECYVNEILQTISSNKLNAAICANAIAKRIGKTKNWVVALKSLMLVLRIFQDGDPSFPQEVLRARNRGAKILNLTTFEDYSHSSPYDYTAFVRAFAFYLDQRLDCFISEKLERTLSNKDKPRRCRRVNQQPVREMKPPMLLDRILYWQRLLDRAIATRPTGAAKNNRLVQVSLYAILWESFDLYRDISDGLGLLLDSFFHLQHQSCINVFEYCVKATKQFEELSSFYDYCKELGIGKTSEYPRVQQISEELMETLQEFLKDQASFPSHNSCCLPFPPPADDPEETDDEPTSPFLSAGHYSEAVEEQCHEQDDMYDVHETGSNHSLPVHHQSRMTKDFASFDAWLTSENKSQEPLSSAMANSTNGGDSLFDNCFQQDHKQEQAFENEANGVSLFSNWLEEDQSKEASQNGVKAHSFVDDCLQENQQHEQDHLNVAQAHSFVNGHTLSVDNWLWEDKKEPEEQQQKFALNSSNDGCKEGWELVLAEATPQPAQASQHFAYGIEPCTAIDLFDQTPTEPQGTCNPIIEDEAHTSATTAINSNTAFPEDFSMEPTFQTAPPTFFAQGPNEMVRPTFQAMPTSLSEDPNRTTVALQENVYDDPFAVCPTVETTNNASFNGSDDQQNLSLQQELWLQNQTKILNKNADSKSEHSTESRKRRAKKKKKQMVNKAWKIIPRPLLETVLNNHAQHHRVPQPLILHGPRGVGKTTLILDRLLGEWNKGPHLTGYVDFAQSIKDHHPNFDGSFPWYSWSSCELPSLSSCRTQLENCLESMAHKGIKLGTISSHQIFTTLNKWHGINTALRRILNQNASKTAISDKVSSSGLWDRAVFALSARYNASEIDGVLDFQESGKTLSIDEASYIKEAVVALRLAKEVIKLQQKWRANAIADLNRSGRFSRSLANSCTDWPCLLLELISQAAEIDHFQPKLVINNVEILRNAMLTEDTMVCGSMYHDSLIWRIIALGANERCLPVILVTSDSYYSYQAFMDFGFPDIFISRETFGWTPQEAKMHMVTDYFTSSEWMVIDDVLGPNPRHLFELYVLKQSNYYQKLMDNEASTFEDIVDAYLAYLQVTIVNPSMDKALTILQKFAIDAQSGKILEDKLRFGAPWRHPPSSKDPAAHKEWAKIQLMDFIQSLVNAEFGINYLADCSLEILDDPAAVALVEVGLLYAQRDPSFFRPISKGIQRCLARWLVQERMQLSYQKLLQYLWQRIIRGEDAAHINPRSSWHRCSSKLHMKCSLALLLFHLSVLIYYEVAFGKYVKKLQRYCYGPT